MSCQLASRLSADRGGEQHDGDGEREPHGHDARGDRAAPLRGVGAVGGDVVGVVDEVDARRGERERHERDDQVQRHPAAEQHPARERRGEHQDVLDPLLGPHRLEHAARDAPAGVRRAGAGAGAVGGRGRLAVVAGRRRRCRPRARPSGRPAGVLGGRVGPLHLGGTFGASGRTGRFGAGHRRPSEVGRRRGRAAHGERDGGAQRGARDDVAGVVHAQHEPRQRHRGHEHGHEGAAQQSAVEDGGGGGGGGVRRGEREPARRADADLDARVVRTGAAHDPLDADRRAVGQRDPGRGGEPLAAARAVHDAPSAPSASQPPACSPKNDMPRATPTARHPPAVAHPRAPGSRRWRRVRRSTDGGRAAVGAWWSTSSATGRGLQCGARADRVQRTAFDATRGPTVGPTRRHPPSASRRLRHGESAFRVRRVVVSGTAASGVVDADSARRPARRMQTRGDAAQRS